MNKEEWLEDGLYLPECIRDFHEQKKIFKRVQWLVDEARKSSGFKKSFSTEIPEWNINHIYTIDFFLWFMAKRGYTLQRSRMKFNFIDIEESKEEVRKKEADILISCFADPHKDEKKECDCNIEERTFCEEHYNEMYGTGKGEKKNE